VYVELTEREREREREGFSFLLTRCWGALLAFHRGSWTPKDQFLIEGNYNWQRCRFKGVQENCELFVIRGRGLLARNVAKLETSLIFWLYWNGLLSFCDFFDPSTVRRGSYSINTERVLECSFFFFFSFFFFRKI
jgi:hypothetical protein